MLILDGLTFGNAIWDYSVPILRDIPVVWMRMFRWQNVLKSLDDICSGCRDGCTVVPHGTFVSGGGGGESIQKIILPQKRLNTACTPMKDGTIDNLKNY
jgi:hypothetical protein